MKKRNEDKLAKLNAAVPAAPLVAKKTPARRNVLDQRDNALGRIVANKERRVKHFMHPPDRIKLWDGHNRDYALLSVERCADLIDGFKRTGNQEFPAIVRPLKDDPEHDYELICGARRKWTAAHLGWDLLVEIRDLDDRQAFILQDLENRDREDVSDYERAVDYRRALPKYFDNNRSHMAKFLEVDAGNFTRLLDLADLPKPVVAAYPDLRELKIHHGATYKRLLADQSSRSRLLEASRQLRKEQDQQSRSYPGRKIFSRLKAACRNPASAPAERKYGSLKVRSTGAGWQLRVDRPKVIDDKATARLRRDFEAFLSELGRE